MSQESDLLHESNLQNLMRRIELVDRVNDSINGMTVATFKKCVRQDIEGMKTPFSAEEEKCITESIETMLANITPNLKHAPMFQL